MGIPTALEMPPGSSCTSEFGPASALFFMKKSQQNVEINHYNCPKFRPTDEDVKDCCLDHRYPDRVVSPLKNIQFPNRLSHTCDRTSEAIDAV